MTSNIVVLGCGLGGLKVSSLVSKQLGRSGTVTIVEPRAKIPLPSSLPWLAFSWREPNRIQKDLKRLAKRKNVRMVAEKVEKINVTGRTIDTRSHEIVYDKLVISLGADLALDEIPGLDTYSHTMYSLEGALKLRDAIKNFQGGTVVVGVCRTPYKCPAAPYELSLLMEETCDEPERGLTFNSSHLNHTRSLRREASLQNRSRDLSPVAGSSTFRRRSW